MECTKSVYDDTVILISLTPFYVDVLTNWLAFYYRLCPNFDHIYLLCFDNSLKEDMKKYGLPCNEVFPHAQYNKEVFRKRLSSMKSLLDQGKNVLMADIDALFLKWPLSTINNEINRYESDIVASRGKFPLDLYDKYGSTICMGFIYFKSTEDSKLVIDIFLKDAYEKGWKDDQKRFNEFLNESSLIYSSIDLTPKWTHIIDKRNSTKTKWK